MEYIVSIYSLDELEILKDDVKNVILFSSPYSLIYKDLFLDEAIKKCLEYKINYFIGINKLINENEIPNIKKLILKYKDAKFYVTDLGVLNILESLNKLKDTIYDGITLICNSLDYSFLSSLNILSIGVSNEIPLKDLLNFKDNIFLQVFGRRVMFYSKRKLIKAYKNYKNVKFESSFYYLKEQKREGLMPLIENDNGIVIYRDYYISLLKNINNLMPKIKYAYLESFTLDIKDFQKIVVAYKNENINEINKLQLNIKDGFNNLDSETRKEI